jgi:hypothetical protein
LTGRQQFEKFSGESTIRLSRWKQEKRWLSSKLRQLSAQRRLTTATEGKWIECSAYQDEEPSGRSVWSSKNMKKGSDARSRAESAADSEALAVRFEVAWQSHSHRMV